MLQTGFATDDDFAMLAKEGVVVGKKFKVLEVR